MRFSCPENYISWGSSVVLAALTGLNFVSWVSFVKRRIRFVVGSKAVAEKGGQIGIGRERQKSIPTLVVSYSITSTMCSR